MFHNWIHYPHSWHLTVDQISEISLINLQFFCSIRKHVSKELKEKPFSIEGNENQEWVLIDYIDVVVHVFQREIREYYDIENLWGDAKITNVELNA